MNYSTSYALRYSRRKQKEMMKAISFALFLATVLMLSILMALDTSGPIILGTEMNANGMVEYLCLGSDCDGLRPMDW